MENLTHLRMASLSRLLQSFLCLSFVFSDAASGHMDAIHMKQSVVITLVSRFTLPFHRLAVVLPHAIAFFIKQVSPFFGANLRVANNRKLWDIAPCCWRWNSLWESFEVLRPTTEFLGELRAEEAAVSGFGKWGIFRQPIRREG